MSSSASRVLTRLILVGGLCCGVVSCSSGALSPGRHAAHTPSPSVAPTHVQAVTCPHATTPPAAHRTIHILLANGNGVPGSDERVVVRPGTRIVATARLMNVLFRDPTATNKAVLARLTARQHPSRPVSVSATFLAVKPGGSRIVAKEPAERGVGNFWVSTFVRVDCDSPPDPTTR
jgi:hypothetical protein